MEKVTKEKITTLESIDVSRLWAEEELWVVLKVVRPITVSLVQFEPSKPLSRLYTLEHRLPQTSLLLRPTREYVVPVEEIWAFEALPWGAFVAPYKESLSQEFMEGRGLYKIKSLSLLSTVKGMMTIVETIGGARWSFNDSEIAVKIRAALPRVA